MTQRAPPPSNCDRSTMEPETGTGFAVRGKSLKHWSYNQRPTTLTEGNRLRPSYSFPSGVGRLSTYPALYSPDTYYAAGSLGAYSRYGATRPLNVHARPTVQTTSPGVSPTKQQYGYTHASNVHQRRHTLASERASLLMSPPPSVSLIPRLSVELPTMQVNSSHAPATRWRDSMASLWPAPATSLKQYSELLWNPDRGIPLQERMVKGQIQRVFTGADAIEWFMDNMVGITTVEQAQLAGEQLLRCGLVINLSDAEEVIKVAGQLCGISRIDYTLSENMNSISSLDMVYPSEKKFLGSPNSLYQFINVTQTSDELEKEESKNATASQEPDQNTKKWSNKCIVQ